MIYIIAAIALIVYLFLSKNSRAIARAGKKGEKILYKNIKKSIGRDSVILRNVELPLYEGVTEIDMLIISKSGLIIIENKHLSGTIFGEREANNWIQDKNGNIKEFYNPLKQNHGHFKCLIHNLKKNRINGIDINSIVIFSHPLGKLALDHPFVYDLDQGILEVKRLSARKGNINVMDMSKKIKSISKKYK